MIAGTVCRHLFCVRVFLVCRGGGPCCSFLAGGRFPKMKLKRTMEMAMVVAGGLVVSGVVSGAGSVAVAQDAPAPMARSEQTQVALAAGTVILGAMSSGLDSKKAKAGDTFTARTTQALKSGDGRTIMPRGTKLQGHV